MESTLNTPALGTLINEIKNTCPAIANIFVLDKNMQLLAKDAKTTEETTEGIINAFTPLVEQTTLEGGIETVFCESPDRKFTLTQCSGNYFVTLSSSEADQKAIVGLTRLLVQTMVKLLHSNLPTLNENEAPPSESANISSKVDLPLVPKSPGHEFIVENLSGLSIISGSPDRIRVDRALIGLWKEMYGQKKISEAIVEESSAGKTVRCKWDLIKGSKLEGQGLVQIPDRIKSILGVEKGAVVRLRPVIEDDTS